MEKRSLGKTGLSISPLVLGTNVFGWTIDEQTSFSVLDAFVERGFNAIDTADVYSYWVPGNHGGEAETIIGRWLKARPGVRDKVVLFTKVGWDFGQNDKMGLSKRWITEAVEKSLSRLGVEAIDVYFSHQHDPETPPEETLATYADLLAAGKIKAIGASNFNATQLRETLAIADANGLPRYQVIQPEYNLYDRSSFEGELQNLSVEEDLGVVTYSSLASGFLTGKYRSKSDLDQSARGGLVTKYFNPRGDSIISALDAVASAHGAHQGEVALAWIMARDGVTAPIASATNLSHVDSFLKAASLSLSFEQVAVLDEAGNMKR